jgi:hypothetical protein
MGSTKAVMNIMEDKKKIGFGHTVAAAIYSTMELIGYDKASWPVMASAVGSYMEEEYWCGFVTVYA